MALLVKLTAVRINLKLRSCGAGYRSRLLGFDAEGNLNNDRNILVVLYIIIQHSILFTYIHIHAQF